MQVYCIPTSCAVKSYGIFRAVQYHSNGPNHSLEGARGCIPFRFSAFSTVYLQIYHNINLLSFLSHCTIEPYRTVLYCTVHQQSTCTRQWQTVPAEYSLLSNLIALVVNSTLNFANFECVFTNYSTQNLIKYS